MSLMSSLTMFPCNDIVKTAEWYVEKLDFRRVDYLNVKQPHICLYRDQIEIILTSTNGAKVVPNHINYGYGYDAYFITEDGEKLQQKMKDKNVKIIKEVSITDYQNQELLIEDCDGRWICFGVKKQEKHDNN